MGKDYAGRGSGRRQASPKPALPGWIWLLAGIAIGVTIAAGYYISRPAPSAAPAAEARPSAKAAAPRKIEVPPKEPSRFTFYELLPDFEVVIPKEIFKQKAKAPAARVEGATGESYLLQVGSFKKRPDAEQQKANLALLGIESRIESVTIDDHDTWFRVRVGPEADPAKVQEMLARLDENDIEALVMRVRR